MEPICQTQSIVKTKRFNLLKIKQLRFAYLEGFVLYASQRPEESPIASILVFCNIGFGFRLISDLPISE